MMNPYHHFVTEFARLIHQGKTLPLGGFTPLERPKPAAHAPTALIFSPHPDDEVIIGALPLRLLRELKWNVINVAVTQGSNPARQPERPAVAVDAPDDGRAQVVRTIRSDDGTWWLTLFGTEPRKNRLAPVIPLLPTTMMSTPWSAAMSQSTSAGSPFRASLT